MWEWLLFFLVIFVYIHVVQQFKYSDENEVFEMDYVDNANLQEVCQLMQPVVFKCTDVLPSLPDLEIPTLQVYDTESPKYSVPTPFLVARELMDRETPASTSPKKYYSEHNEECLKSSDVYDKVQELDGYLRPPLNAVATHDVNMGAVGSYTPFRYHVCSRKFLVIVSGKLSVKMAPWKKHAKHLHEERDYELGEYRSQVNVWEPKEHHRRDVTKTDFLEFDVEAGYIVSIPSYWGYSVQYSVPRTSTVEYTYSTWSNQLAFVGETGRRWLQSQNVYYSSMPTRSTKKKEGSELSQIPQIPKEGSVPTPASDLEEGAPKAPPSSIRSEEEVGVLHPGFLWPLRSNSSLLRCNECPDNHRIHATV